MSGAKLILITGATRGLGRAMVEEFIRLGHTLLGCGTSPDQVRALQKRFPSPHQFAVVDVAQDSQVRDWVSSWLPTHGAPDLVLNNAAVINPNAPLWEVEEAVFSRVMDVNIKGVANVIRHVVPAMLERGRGIIVNFSSGWGRSTDRDVAPYCASKWAIEGLTQALAQELPRGLAAMPLNPGIIHTDMLQSCFGSGAAQYPSPAQWARTAAPFLLGLSAKDNGRPLTAPGN